MTHFLDDHGYQEKLPEQLPSQDTAPQSAQKSKVSLPVTRVDVKPPKRKLFGNVGRAFKSFLGRKNTETPHDQSKLKPLPPIKEAVQESQVINANEIPTPNVDRDEHLVGEGEISKKEEEIPAPNVDRDEYLLGEVGILQKEDEIPPPSVNRDENLVLEGEISQKEEKNSSSQY